MTKDLKFPTIQNFWVIPTEVELEIIDHATYFVWNFSMCLLPSKGSLSLSKNGSPHYGTSRKLARNSD